MPVQRFPLEAMNKAGDGRPIGLDDWRSSADKASVRALGIALVAKGSTIGAVCARERAARAVWFKHRAQLRRSKIPVPGRIACLFSAPLRSGDCAISWINDGFLIDDVPSGPLV